MMFWFIACIHESGEATNCTPPVAVYAEAECRKLEQAYVATLKDTTGGSGRVKTRCVPAETSPAATDRP